jgi:hypothetical protein
VTWYVFEGVGRGLAAARGLESVDPVVVKRIPAAAFTELLM